MSENTNTDMVNDGADVNTEATITDPEMINMSKADFDKSIQSAEDKLRTKYSKDIKKLEDRIKELTPPAKTEDEVAFENRLAALEAKEKETEAKEKRLTLQSQLQSNEIDMSMADYLNPNIDIDEFVKLFGKIVNDKVIANGYKPTDHQTTTEVTSDQWGKMSYSEKEKMYKENPSLVARLIHKK